MIWRLLFPNCGILHGEEGGKKGDPAHGNVNDTIKRMTIKKIKPWRPIEL
jgi:hypothetical protein